MDTSLIEFKKGFRLKSGKVVTTDAIMLSYEEANQDAKATAKKLGSSKSVFEEIVNGGRVLIPRNSIDYIEFYLSEVS